ncbi:MAG: hypothetical protein AB1758_15745, partial [Candidatus Eremiobacterota bacterium]
MLIPPLSTPSVRAEAARNIAERLDSLEDSIRSSRQRHLNEIPDYLAMARAERQRSRLGLGAA